MDNISITAITGGDVRTLRRKLHIPQKVLAAAIGYSVRTLRAIECGQRSLSPQVADLISAYVCQHYESYQFTLDTLKRYL